jgi:hypothetical protein
MSMLRRSIMAGATSALMAGAMIALLTAPAAAQFPAPGLSLHNGPKQLTPAERAKQKAIDDAYKAATHKIPDKQAADDPWASIRPGPSSAKGVQR